MEQGLLVWSLSLLLSYFIINALSLKLKFLSRRYLTILFLFHSLLAAAYYLYALYNPSDSRGYYGRVFNNWRGEGWIDYYGTSTTFVEFIGYPFIKYFEFTYESIMVVFSFLGFIGFLFFYVFFREHIRLNHRIFSIDFLMIVFFLPNLHFWSSSFGKGALIFCGLGLFFYGLNKPMARILALIAGGFLIYMIRPHIFFVTMIAMAIGYTFSTRGVSIVYRLIVVIISVVLINYIYEDILRITGLEDESIFDESFSTRADRLTRATSGIDITTYSLPEKMFAFWFRPLFFDAPGILGLIVSFENLFYLLVFGYLLRPRSIGYLFRADAITKTCYLTFIGISVALAQISGNLGLAMRQKSQVMILMLFAILKLLDEQKIVQFRSVFLKRHRQKRMAFKVR